jgi:hypothetical protein
MTKRKCPVWRTRTGFAIIAAPTQTETGLHVRKRIWQLLKRDSVIWIHSVTYRNSFCHSRLERWVLYALANQNSWSITCTNHPMSAPVTSPSFLQHTWHTCSLSAAVRVLRLLSWSSYVISTDFSSIGRTSGHITSTKFESMTGHL